jgi:hypothetical protein
VLISTALIEGIMIVVTTNLMLDFRFGIMFLQYFSWIYTWDCIVIICYTM